jgi:hypothetical protein
MLDMKIGCGMVPGIADCNERVGAGSKTLMAPTSDTSGGSVAFDMGHRCFQKPNHRASRNS